MKGILYFLLGLAVLVGGISAFWWIIGDASLDEQMEYVKSKVGDSIEDSAAANTAESASKLGRVLKNNFEDAQDVFENGAERY